VKNSIEAQYCVGTIPTGVAQAEIPGFVKVFSNNLGDAIGVTPAVVRKDFSVINIPGNKRGGYNIDTLIELLGNVLGKNQPHEVIIVGCGRIGSPSWNTRNSRRRGSHRGRFRYRSLACGNAVERSHPRIKEMSGFIRSRGTPWASSAAGRHAAANVLSTMISAGIQAVSTSLPSS
jgi:redox-sensing transcriptional repressor